MTLWTSTARCKDIFTLYTKHCKERLEARTANSALLAGGLALQHPVLSPLTKKTNKTNSEALSPRANYTD
jgi:hypothetical protein